MSKYKTYDGYPLIETTNFNIIRELADYTVEFKKLAMLVGNPGYGKTGTFQFLHENYGKVLYKDVTWKQPAKEFFAQFLATVLGSKPDQKWMNNKQIYHLIERAAYSIREQQISLIIFDELGNFNRGMIPFIRQIWDSLRGNIGMIIAGPASFNRDMEKWTHDDVKGISELMDRISRKKFLENHTFDDVKLVCESRGVHEGKTINAFFRKCPNLRILQSSIDDYKAGLNDPS